MSRGGNQHDQPQTSLVHSHKPCVARYIARRREGTSFKQFHGTLPTRFSFMFVHLCKVKIMLLCLSCDHFYRRCPVPEKKDPPQRFYQTRSYRPEGCAQWRPVEFKKRGKEMDGSQP
ncbi:MAG: hypothetical protein LUP95_06050 [Euryarchaeota archaeon]|nr:hypothetical protein [Euryarchaeota archaeon]